MITIDKNDIDGITLLSVEEAKKLPKWLLANGTWWWLRSPGDTQGNAAFVGSGGSVYSGGVDVGYAYVCVRPALIIKNLSNLRTGDLVEVLGREAQFVGTGMVLLCEPIAYHRFDKYSNDYENSEVKNFVEEWLKEEKTRK